MPTKRYSTEQIVSKLRQAEVELARGLRTPAMCKKLGISEQTYYCTAPGSLDTHLCYAAWRSTYSSRASIGV